MHAKQNKILIGGLVSTTVLSALFLSFPSVFADTGFVDVITIDVPVSCSLSATGTNSHVDTVQNGSTGNDIGTTNIKVTCNDNTGYALYAIGYTNDEYGYNKLHSATLGTSNDIITSATITTSTSSWAMKLAATSGTYAPTIVTNFASYAAVPTEYTKVAYYPSSTDLGTSAVGSNLTTTYRAYISPTQPAGIYVGQVKYVLVHPNTAAAPIPPSSSCDNPVPGAVYMQDINSSNKSTIMSGMTQNTQYYLKDSRDEKPYCVAKLADGNIWMTQNLDHDIDSTFDYNSSNTDVPANWSDTLVTTYATSNTTWSSSATTPESYDPGNLCWNGTPVGNYTGTLSTRTEACGSNKQYHMGNYYNWTAMVAMEDSSSYTAGGTDADQSICPAGWMLPKNSGSGSFSYLVSQLGLTSNNIYNSPVYFVFAGSYGNNGSGVSMYVGDMSMYSTSVLKDSGNAYAIGAPVGGGMNAQGSVGRGGGYPVRCVAR